jgi:hypothetical protein
MTNGGHNKDEIDEIYNNMLYDIETLSQERESPLNPLVRFVYKLLGRKTTYIESYNKIQARPFWYTYDAMNFEYGNGIDIGVVDSASAVLMSIKNSLGVAKMLMGLSGIVVFQRDSDLDRSEADNYHSEQAAINEAINNAKREEFEPPY